MRAIPRIRRTNPAPVTRPGVSRTAVLVALGVSFIVIAIILLVTSNKGPAQRSALDEMNEGDIPDILSAPPGGGAGLDQAGMTGATQNAKISLKDRDDPTRTVWYIEFASLDPVRNTDLVKMTHPRAWYYVGDESLVFITSDEAEFAEYQVGQEPSSGRFIGNVEILQFERTEGGALPDPVETESSVRITTNWMDFDAVASELTTTEHVLIESESIDADCEGLRVVFNEVDERIELLEVPGALLATVRPGQPSEEDSADQPPVDPGAGERPNQGVQASRGDVPQAPQEAEPEGPEQFYAVTFEGSVRVEQPMRRIDADRAHVWLRLVNNEIPDGNFARRMPMAPRAPDPMRIDTMLAALAVASSQPEIPTDRDMQLGEDVLFRCVGPTVVRPMNERPAALGSGDDVVLRFEANQGGVVTFSDDVLPATGEASAIEYGFTNKLLAFTGYDGNPTTIEAHGSGTIMGESLTIGLSTGIGQAMGSGVLTEADTGRSLTWTDQADVVFRTEGGWLTGSIEQAIASGGIVLNDTEANVTADSINTRFMQAEGSDEALLERAVLTGAVKARTADGSLDADRLDVRFETSSGKSQARAITASGNVRGVQDDATITAGLLEADLVTDKSGDARVTIARASEGVRFDREDGAFAQGERLRADLTTEAVEVEGVPAIVGSGAAQVASRTITLDGQSRSIHVPGQGEFTLRSEDGARTLATATWTESMAYADESGELEAVGEVVAVSTPDALTNDTLRGDRLFALVMPADGSAAALDENVDRSLIGASIASETERGASVEIVRFKSEENRTPARITRLDSTQIDIDNIGGTLNVPAPGRLLVSDQRLETESTDNASLRGSALFDWQDSLLLDRPAGTLEITGRVRMIHRPLRGGADVELECEAMQASFTEEGGTEQLTGQSGQGELDRALASGAVWARSGDQQILADTLDYSAITQRATASANQGSWVTLFDPAQPAPVTAAELLWSLDNGRIEVIRPNPVSIPQ